MVNSMTSFYRLREAKGLAQRHTARRQSWDSRTHALDQFNLGGSITYCFDFLIMTMFFVLFVFYSGFELSVQGGEKKGLETVSSTHWFAITRAGWGWVGGGQHALQWSPAKHRTRLLMLCLLSPLGPRRLTTVRHQSQAACTRVTQCHRKAVPGTLHLQEGKHGQRGAHTVAAF